MKLGAVGLVLGLAACGLRPTPVPRPGPPAGGEPRIEIPAPPVARVVMIGEMCPDGAHGRPGLAALALRKERAWSASPQELRVLAAGIQVPRLAVFGFGGRKVGNFTALGPLDTGARWPVVLGGYAGSPPCVDESSAVECAASQHGCGLAVGAAGQAEDFATGAACAQDGNLLVDLDGDGNSEAFPAAAFAARAEEVLGHEARATCAPRFAARGIAQGVDLIGVIDLDGDGRKELIVQVSGEWLIYAPLGTAARLVRVAEATPWATAPASTPR